MTTQKERNQLAGLACKALKEYYGFAPSRNQIVLLEGSFDRTFCEQLLFKVRGKGFEYEIKYRCPGKTGNITVGEDTYDLTVREAELFYMK